MVLLFVTTVWGLVARYAQIAEVEDILYLNNQLQIQIRLIDMDIILVIFVKEQVYVPLVAEMDILAIHTLLAMLIAHIAYGTAEAIILENVALVREQEKFMA